jgi:hypothetical protein
MTSLRIPKEYWKDFATKFAESWGLGRWNGTLPNESYDQYMDGIANIGSPPPEVLRHTEGERMTTNKGCNGESASRNTLCPRQPGRVYEMSAEQEQDLIDVQLHAELASFLQDHAPKGSSPASRAAQEISPQTSRASATLKPQTESRSTTRPSRYAKPRSSSLFIFDPPRLHRRDPDWERLHDRDISPTPTGRCALDTFTAELLAKAEEASTMGSFSRGPSTIRGTSEVEIVMGREKQVQKGGEGREGKRVGMALERAHVVIDVDSDHEDDDDSVGDLGLEIVGSRTIDG